MVNKIFINGAGKLRFPYVLLFWIAAPQDPHERPSEDGVA